MRQNFLRKTEKYAQKSFKIWEVWVDFCFWAQDEAENTFGLNFETDTRPRQDFMTDFLAV